MGKHFQNPISMQLYSVSLFVVLSTFYAVTNTAAAANPKLHWYTGFNSTNGNASFSDFTIPNGNTSHIEPGGGIHVYAGAIYHSQPWLDILMSAGIHYDHASSANGSNHFSRYPLEIVPSYVSGDHRFAAGLSYHINPELKGDDIINQAVSFDNALGTLLEYGYQATPFLYLGLRAMAIEYKVSNPNAATSKQANGNHFGVNLNYQF